VAFFGCVVGGVVFSIERALGGGEASDPTGGTDDPDTSDTDEFEAARTVRFTIESLGLAVALFITVRLLWRSLPETNFKRLFSRVEETTTSDDSLVEGSSQPADFQRSGGHTLRLSPMHLDDIAVRYRVSTANWLWFLLIGPVMTYEFMLIVYAYLDQRGEIPRKEESEALVPTGSDRHRVFDSTELALIYTVFKTLWTFTQGVIAWRYVKESVQVCPRPSISHF
jgi:hypothetical protein